MFVGPVDLKNGTCLELVIAPLKGTVLRGQWETKTDLLMVCVIQTGRCCPCRPNDRPSRYVEKLGLPPDDAKHLSEWMSGKICKTDQITGIERWALDRNGSRRMQAL